MADIAKAVGVTKSAVSLALKNHPRISKTRRKQIQKAARQLGYQPNSAAGRLARFKRNSKARPIQAALGWLNFWDAPQKLRGYAEFEHYWQGATKAAENMGFRLEDFNCSNPAKIGQVKRILQVRGIEGLIIPPGGLPHEWKGFPWELFSIVRIARRPEDPGFHSVTSNRAASAMLAFETIRKYGYNRIGFVGAPLRHWLWGAGFLWAQHLDLSPKERLPALLFKECPLKNERALARWLERTRPDAILTDRPELMTLMERLGRRVPEDIGIAALGVGGNLRIDAGIYINPQEVGRASATMLVSLIHEQSRGIPSISHEVLIKGAWVDGRCLPHR